MNVARIGILSLAILSCAPIGEGASPSFAALPKLKVSANRRFLVKEDGTPFFPLVDTAWYLPKASNADVGLYLADRASRGFTATMISAKYHNDILFNGAGPYINDNTDTPNEPFWQHVDFIVDQAAAAGLYVGFTIMWCEDWWALVGTDAQKANRLGNWLGTRYRDRTNIYWIVSGEYPDGQWTQAVYDGAAQGLKAGDLGNHLITIHPGGGGTLFTSSQDFQNSSWLDFNMLQSGREGLNDQLGDVYGMITHDYDLTPAKPVFEGESGYEEALLSDGTLLPPDQVRRKAWRSVFAGGFGYTYGNENLEVLFVPGDTPDGYPAGYPHRLWKDALSSPGAAQMKHLRTLMESRPFLTRIPDQSIIVGSPGNGTGHAQATRASDGSYAFVYIPDGRPLPVDLSKIAGTSVACSWYDPRTGTATSIGTVPATGTMSFDPPGGTAVGDDWVLMMDAVDAASGLSAIADTFVKENDATSYGSMTEVDVKGQSTVTRYGYLKFDTSSVTGTLQQARLQMRLLPSGGWVDSGTAAVYGFDDNSWSESTVWSTRPSDAALGSSFGSVPLPILQDQAPWEVNVTDYVNARRAAGQTTVSFSLRSLSNNNSGLAVYSRESSLPPQLLLVAAPGSPSTPTGASSPKGGKGEANCGATGLEVLLFLLGIRILRRSA